MTQALHDSHDGTFGPREGFRLQTFMISAIIRDGFNIVVVLLGLWHCGEGNRVLRVDLVALAQSHEVWSTKSV